MPTQHAIYSDDSGWPNKRYQSLAAVSGTDEELCRVRTKLRSVLESRGRSEFRIRRTSREVCMCEVGREFLDCAVRHACCGKVRIDVLTLNMTDSRHGIEGRDNTANLQRMYYHLFLHIARSWKTPLWNVFPDENSPINWAEVREYLSTTHVVKREPYMLSLFKADRASFWFASVKEQCSKEEPLVQLADLFAGLARFSREHGRRFLSWRQQQRRKVQPELFGDHRDQEVSVSRGEKNRFMHLLGPLDDMCKDHKLTVSMESKGYLHTWDNRKPINFWNWEPQTDMDKAPVKEHGVKGD